LFCNEADLHAHNNEVDSSAELLALIKKAGGAINASECKGNYGENTGVPNFSPQTNLCFFSSASRSPSKFDCAKKPWPASKNKQRLCYCSHNALSRTAPRQNQVQVTGAIEVTVNEPDIILNDPEAKIAFEDAMAAEIASTLGLRSSAVTVTASKDDSGRRLVRGRRLANDGLLLAYVINALAPATTANTTVTADALLNTMKSLNTISLQSQVNNAVQTAAADAPALKDVKATDVKLEVIPSILVIKSPSNSSRDEKLDFLAEAHVSGTPVPRAMAFITFMAVFAHFILVATTSQE